MNITEYLKATHKTQYHERDNITLLRPIVNIFAGEFDEDEKSILVETLRDRVGTSTRLHFCKICVLDTQVEDGICKLKLDAMNGIGEYEIEKWDNIRDGMKDSGLPEAIKDYAATVFNEAGEFSFESRGWIRLNFIVKMDWAGTAAFDQILSCFKSEFGKYYENGVLTDVYCLLDQKAYSTEEHGDERKALNYRSLDLIEKLMSSKTMNPAFVLSNYTSRNVLEQGFPIPQLRTIALHMIIKDGKTAKLHENSFSEKNFTEEAKGMEGRLATLGSLNLEVDEGTRNQVVYKIVFSDLFDSVGENSAVSEMVTKLGINEDSVKNKVLSVRRRGSVSENQLYPLFMNEKVNPTRILNVNCDEIIEELFGKGLDYYFDNNLVMRDDSEKNSLINQIARQFEDTLLNIFADRKYSLSEIRDAMSEINSSLNDMVDTYKQNISSYEDGLDMWKRSNFQSRDLQKTEKETGVPKVFYQIALEYLGKRARLEQNRLAYEIVEGIKERVSEKVRYTLEQMRTFEEAVNDLEREIDEKIEQDNNDLKYGNIMNYYSMQVEKWINAHNSLYDRFVSELRNKISKNMIAGESIFEYVVKFCDENMLNSPEFSNDFSQEMVCRLKDYKNYHTDESIYGLVFSTIMDNKTFFANSITNGKVPNAVCFLVNPDNKFINSTNKEMNSLLLNQKMSWFFEKSFAGMDILFMEGCFPASRLYQYELYKGAFGRYEEKI
ncbi:MAG: hypothetical protein K6E85_02030 [Lachnospiraceae bacterium]|nr:hypothetical protein [Lachnospiraceae bacterium]